MAKDFENQQQGSLSELIFTLNSDLNGADETINLSYVNRDAAEAVCMRLSDATQTLIKLKNWIFREDKPLPTRILKDIDSYLSAIRFNIKSCPEVPCNMKIDWKDKMKGAVCQARAVLSEVKEASAIARIIASEAMVDMIKKDSSVGIDQAQRTIYTNKVNDEAIEVFISYSWDSENHKRWVADLATRLRSDDGINVILDQWEVALGDQLTHFMEKKIRESKYVLIICTPDYCEKSNNRKGGVGYEDHVMTSEIYREENHRKFIPILAKDCSWKESAPSWLSGKLYVDLSTNDNYKKGYLSLRSTLLGERPTPPPIRRRSSNE